MTQSHGSRCYLSCGCEEIARIDRCVERGGGHPIAGGIGSSGRMVSRGSGRVYEVASVALMSSRTWSLYCLSSRRSG